MPEQVRHDGWAWLLALVLLLANALALPASAQTFPKFTGLVVDDANVLPPPVEADLTAKLEALQKDTKRQLVVATIDDPQGYPLDEYGYKLGRAWGVGLKDVNNGAILLIAPNNPPGQRGPRIEVGRGLEPILTDALSSVIISRDMIPRLKGGDLPGAMTAGTDALIAQLRASPEEAQARLDASTKTFDQTHRRSPDARSGNGGIPFGLIFWLFVIGFVVLSMARRGGGGRRYRGGGGSGLGNVILWSIANEVASSAFRGSGGRSSGWGGGSGGGWGGGGGSDGSWGGGGFTGGGGGDFGGGGASGDW